jgi:hypothetical protein
MARPAPTREGELTGNKGACLLAISKSGQARTVCCAALPKEALMRIPALATLTIATVLTAAPARAQTYDPAYPVCLHAKGAYECRYTSLPQCNASASGRAAQCFINPYFASARVPPGRHYRRLY